MYLVNIPDPLSRLGKGKGVCMNDAVEEFLRFAAESSTPAAVFAQEVEEESWLDPEIPHLKECITIQQEKGTMPHNSIKPF